MMRRHKGLTLLEVLAATVLLSMIAAACVPLLQQAMRHLHTPIESISIFDLAELADAFVADPAQFNVESIQSMDDELPLPWPNFTDRPGILVHPMMADDPAVNHTWLRFSCADRSVYRWITVDPEQESQP